MMRSHLPNFHNAVLRFRIRRRGSMILRKGFGDKDEGITGQSADLSRKLKHDDQFATSFGGK